MAKSILLRNSLLAILPTELLHSLFAMSGTLSLVADQTLFSAGDEGDGCYLVDEGLLNASITTSTGGERIVAIFGSGSVVGELSMIDGAPRSTSITALRNSKLRFINRTTFEAFGQSRSELYRHVTTLLTRRLRDPNDTLVAMSFLSVKGWRTPRDKVMTITISGSPAHHFLQRQLRQTLH